MDGMQGSADVEQCLLLTYLHLIKPYSGQVYGTVLLPCRRRYASHVHISAGSERLIRSATWQVTGRSSH